MAVVFVAFGVVILERLPVTYPREGLVLAAYLPASGFAVSTALLLALREAGRRWRGRPRTYPFAIEALLLLRATAVLLPVLSVHFLLKSFIWLVNARTWDAFLWDADRFVHLGLSPSLLLTGAFTSVVNDPLALRYVRFGCVAAFPGLNLAVVTVFTAASRRLSRGWFLANVVTVFLMLIGSVVSGYHYLVDGWAGIVLGLGAYRLGCRLFPDSPWKEGAIPASGSSPPAPLQRP